METLIILGIIGLGGLIWHEKDKVVPTPSNPVGTLPPTAVGNPFDPTSMPIATQTQPSLPVPIAAPVAVSTNPVLHNIYSGTPIMSGPYTLDSSEHVVDASGVDAVTKRETPSVL